jgi:glycosyltransferase involved in cell wall biosynthesis
VAEPQVSVIMPVRDAAAHLAAALDSIRGQSLAEIEILVVDDGSRDGTPGILEAAARADPRLRAIRQDAAGIVPALDRAIEAARAPLLARMDADDLAMPERLARQAAFLGRHPSVAVVGGACRLIDRRGRLLGLWRPPTDPAVIAARLPVENCLSHPTVMMRRDAVLQAGGYRAAFVHCEDYDLWLRVAERHALANLPEVMLAYRLHGGQATWRALEPRILAELAAFGCAARRRAGAPDPAAGVAVIDRALLARILPPGTDLDAAIAARALAAARAAAAVGQGRAAWAGLRLAARQRQAGLGPRLRWLRAAGIALVEAGRHQASLASAKRRAATSSQLE